MRDIQGTLYCNDGDWVESRSALVEHMDGHLEVVLWDDILTRQAKALTAVPLLGVQA
jgi:hypothetical protein